MKILVTGTAGFIGYYLAKTLAKNPGDEIVCVDNLINGKMDDLYSELIALPSVSHLDINLSLPEQVDRLPDDCEMVFHMAALNGTQNFYERPYDVLVHSTMPTINLLNKYGPSKRIRRFVYAGSSEAYASTVTRFGWPLPTAEDVPLSIDDVTNVRWSYGASKMHGEVAVIAAHAQFGIPFSVARIHNAYGPRMGVKHVIPDFLNRAKKGEFVLYGHANTRTFIYADDAAAAILELARAEACLNEIINVGGVREISMEQLARLTMSVCGMAGDLRLEGAPEGSVMRRVPDTSKLARLTTFKEQWTLEDGLRKTAEYYLAS